MCLHNVDRNNIIFTFISPLPEKRDNNLSSSFSFGSVWSQQALRLNRGGAKPLLLCEASKRKMINFGKSRLLSHFKYLTDVLPSYKLLFNVL